MEDQTNNRTSQVVQYIHTSSSSNESCLLYLRQVIVLIHLSNKKNQNDLSCSCLSNRALQPSIDPVSLFWNTMVNFPSYYKLAVIWLVNYALENTALRELGSVWSHGPGAGPGPESAARISSHWVEPCLSFTVGINELWVGFLLLFFLGRLLEAFFSQTRSVFPGGRKRGRNKRRLSIKNSGSEVSGGRL